MRRAIAATNAGTAGVADSKQIAMQGEKCLPLRNRSRYRHLRRESAERQGAGEDGSRPGSGFRQTKVRG